MKAFKELRGAAQDLIDELDQIKDENEMPNTEKMRLLERAWADWRRPGRFKVGDVVMHHDWADPEDSGPAIVVEVYDPPLRNDPTGAGATEALGYHEPLDVMLMFVLGDTVCTELSYSGALKPYEEEIAF